MIFMAITSIAKQSIIAYMKNLKLISLFSVPFLLALLIPLFTPMPTFMALGGTFLRTGSMPQLTLFETGVIILSCLTSMFLISFAFVAINLVIKSQRTLTNIKTEVLKGMKKYIFTLFAIYSFAWILTLAVTLIAFETGSERIVGPLASLITYTLLFYVPAAMVIDDQSIWRAFRTSATYLYRKPLYVLLWMLLAFSALSLLEFTLLEVMDHTLAEYAVLVVNSIILLPMLVVIQTQMYLSKYTIL